MKILYLSCHSILEYDELRLFTEMDATLGTDFNIEVFSMGAFMNPTQSGDYMRSVIPKGRLYPELYGIGLQCDKDRLHPELVEWADVIVSMHNSKLPGQISEQPWIVNNWDLLKLKNKKVIWRSIGQSTPSIEKELHKYRVDGLKVVRYSQLEEAIPDYMGADAMIPFAKDPEEFNEWTGIKPSIMTAVQSFKKRGQHVGYHVFESATSGLPRRVFGTENEDLGDIYGGVASYEGLKQAMREHRAFFYFGTQPAPYTLSFIEAMMTGIPIVAAGNNLRNSGIYPWNNYEIPDIIKHGVNGFVVENIAEMRGTFERLINNHALARSIGEQGRQTAIERYGKIEVMKKWAQFFKTL